jgi:hypothetical protein
MKTTIIAIAAAAVLSLAATPAIAQECLTDGRILTMKGTVVDKAFTDYDKGQAFQHHYTALLFDRPRCVDTEFGSGPAEMFEQFGYLDGDTQLVGHRVITKVQVSEAGGTIHYPTSVVLFPLDVRIMKAPTRTCSIIFDEKHPITLHGMIVQSATTEEEEGEPIHARFILAATRDDITIQINDLNINRLSSAMRSRISGSKPGKHLDRISRREIRRPGGHRCQ